MQTLRLAAVLLLVTARPMRAQTVRDGWELSLLASHVGFTGAARDPVAVRGSTAELHPGSRFAGSADLSHRHGLWEFALSLGLSKGNLLAQTEDLALTDRTTATNRWRVGLALGRRVVGVGATEVWLSGGPALDYWQVTTLDGKFSPGVEASLSLRVPLGRFEIENRASFGVSGSPFRRSDLPVTTDTRVLRAFSLGIGARYHLSRNPTGDNLHPPNRK
jgi:hypothetical protein